MQVFLQYRYFRLSSRSKGIHPHHRKHALPRSKECFNDWGGRGYDDSSPGDGTKTTPSGDRTTRSPAWSAILPRIQFISPGGWSKKSPGGAISCRPLPKRGKICYIPSPPQWFNDSKGIYLHHRRHALLAVTEHRPLLKQGV